MKSKHLFLFIFVLYFVGFFAHALYLRKTVYGDGQFYYSWLRSAIVDHDINFTNEYAHFHIDQPQTQNRHPGNKYSIGPAILWFPAFITVHTIMNGSGFELPYQLAVGLVSMVLTLFSFVLLYRLLGRYFSSSSSLLTTLSIALATNLFFYGSLDPVNSHALSFFAVTVYMSLLLSRYKNWLAIGIFLGLIGLIRTQDIIFGLLIIPFLNIKSKMIRFDHLIPGIMPGVVGFSVIFGLQLLSWQILYGSFTVNPYLSGGEYFNVFSPHIIQVLFSPANGLLLYSPVLILGIIGLFIWKNTLRWYFFFAVLVQLLIVSSWSTWWQGASYGGRMFVSSLPIFSFGLATFFSWVLLRNVKPVILISFIASLAFLNGLLMVVFLLSK